MYSFVWRRVMEKFFKQFFGYHDAVILGTGALMGWV